MSDGDDDWIGLTGRLGPDEFDRFHGLRQESGDRVGRKMTNGQFIRLMMKYRIRFGPHPKDASEEIVAAVREAILSRAGEDDE